MNARPWVVRLPAALLLGLSFVAGGCAHRKDSAAAYMSTYHVGYSVPYNTAAFLDGSLQKNLSVEQTGSRRSGSNTLAVWASLRNRTDRDWKVAVRTRFFDANQQPLESTSWSTVFLSRRGLQTYETASTTPNAAFYYVEIMEGR